MLEANTLYSFYLCDWHVTVEWNSIAKTGYQIQVMIHGPVTPLHGSDIAIGLLDAHNRPLPRLDPESDHAPMLSVIWAAQETQYKWARFGRVETGPSVLEVLLRGHRVALPLAGMNGKTRAKDAGDDLREGGKEKRGKGKKDEERRDAGGKDGGRRDGNGEKAEPKCCVDTFNTPNGPLPTTTIPVPGVGSTFQCQPWVVTATFGNTAPCTRTCCEYRQYVKGTMTATPPGGGPAQDVSPITDYRVPAGPVAPGGPPLAPLPVRGLNAANFIEDTTGRRNQPGNPSRYGPRVQAKDGTQDYPTDCSYWGLDKPEGKNVAAGTRVQIDVTYKGEIVDTCRGGVSAGPNNWTWKFNKVA